MKPTFKTTALAILVSLGATACLSTSPSNNQQPKQVQPTNPNSQSKLNAQNNSKKSEAEKKAEGEKAKAEREAQQKAAEQKRLEEEAKIKAEEAKNVTDLEEKTRLEREAKEKAEEAKRLEKERIKAEQKAKLEEENRQRLEKERLEREAKEKAEEVKRLEEERIKAEEKAKLEEDNRQRLERERLEKEKQQSSGNERVLSELSKIPEVNGERWTFSVPIGGTPGPNDQVFPWGNYPTINRDYHFYSPINLPEPYESSKLVNMSPFNITDRNVFFELTEKTEEDIRNGGTYLGLHSGVFRNNKIDGVKVTKLIDLPSNIIPPKGPLHGIPRTDTSRNASEIDSNVQEINYMFINQPYSTYGALFTNKHDSKIFYTGLKTDNYGKLYTEEDGTSRLNYIDSLKGDVTYRGDVIAVITRGIKNTGILEKDEPRMDGKITFNAHFGQRSEENYIQGYVDSNTVGRLELEKTKFGTDIEFSGKVTKFHKNESLLSEDSGYGGRFHGKEANDILGRLYVKYNNAYYVVTNGPFSVDIYNEGQNVNVIAEYDAVFGAIKQPKTETPKIEK